MTDAAAALETLRQRDFARVRALVEKEPSLAAARAPDGMTLLRHCIYARAHDAVAALLAAGARPDVFDAAALGDVPRLREIVSADRALANARAPPGDGVMPLHLAAHFGRREAVALLIRLGADVRAVCDLPFGNTPLHAAAAGGQREVAELLLQAGADANALDLNGYAPLHVAAANGDGELARLLVERGARADLAGPGGKTPRQVAAEREQHEVAAFLESRGG